MVARLSKPFSTCTPHSHNYSSTLQYENRKNKQGKIQPSLTQIGKLKRGETWRVYNTHFYNSSYSRWFFPIKKQSRLCVAHQVNTEPVWSDFGSKKRNGKLFWSWKKYEKFFGSQFFCLRIVGPNFEVVTLDDFCLRIDISGEACVSSAHFYSKISLLRPRFDHLLYEVFSRYVLNQPLEELNLWKYIIQFTLTTLETNMASLAYR